MDLNALINASCSQTDYDIAKVVYFLFKDNYVCTCIKENKWYELVDSQWIQCEAAHSLFIKLSLEVAKIYFNFSADMYLKTSAENDVAIIEKHAEKGKKFFEISQKLKNNAFKENIIKECCYLFYVRDFRF